MKTITILTKENASKVSTVINIKNSEWGTKRFNYNDQPLTEGRFASSIGSGSNSALLFEDEFHFWAVNSWK